MDTLSWEEKEAEMWAFRSQIDIGEKLQNENKLQRIWWFQFSKFQSTFLKTSNWR